MNAELPWKGKVGAELIQDLLDDRFNLWSMVDESGELANVGFRIKRGKVGVDWSFGDEHGLLTVAQIRELGETLLSLADLLAAKKTVL